MNTPGMRFMDSRCIHCGANLRVAQDASFVCCQYCNSELQVVRDGSVLTTRLLKDVAEMKGDVSNKLDILRVQNEIERLDREWTLKREDYKVQGKNGSSIPSLAGSLIGGVVVVGFGIFWITMASDATSHGAPAFIPLFGVAVIVIGLVSAVVGMSKASEHDSAQSDYQLRRSALLSQLKRVENASKRS